MTDPFGEPEGLSEFESIKQYVGELVLVKATGMESRKTDFGQQDVVTHDFVVLTGDNAGYQVENSTVLNAPVNRELKPYVNQDRFFLARVETFQTKQKTTSFGFTKATDADKQIARDFLEENGLA